MTRIVPESPAEGNIQPQTLVFIAIVVLVGVAAFGLGRLSAGQSPSAGIIIHQSGDTSPASK